ncbi:MAG: hypothetical protein M4D80_19020 [Myxococcota bacterium]|nr:hypothetical protein [Myxococcota bacterium]
MVALGGCATDPPEPHCESHVLRVTSAVVPHNNAGAREHGLDLNNDKAIDNQLGMVAATLHGQFGFDLTAAINARLASDLVWQIGVATCDDDTARIDRGSAMPVGAMFDPLARFGPGWIESRVAAIELAPLADGTTWTGRIGMGLLSERVNEVIVPPIVAYMNENALFIDEFDKAPKDGMISVEEMADSNIARSLLEPDLGSRGDRSLSFGVAVTATKQPN